MSEWKNIIFKEIAKVQGGFAFKSDYYTDEGSLLVRIGNLQNGKISKQNSVYIKNEFKTYEEFILKESDILMGLTGDLGKIAIICREDLPALLNQRVGRFLPKIEVDLNYIYHLISSQYFIEKLKVFFEGGAQANISPKQIEAVKVIVPESKPEQTQIAEILSTADEAIAHTEALIAKYQRIKTGLMQYLLTCGIDENGNIRSKETHKFKISILGEIPVEWEVVPVGSLCKEIVVGIVIKPTQYYIESGIPMLRSFNIKEGAIEMRDLVYMSESDNNRLSKSKLKENDVVSVRTGYPGTSALITKEIEGCNCIDLVISRVKDELLNPNFLVLWINSHLAKRQILNHQGGNAQQHFNVGQMKGLLIYKMPLKEQIRILNLVNIESKNTDNYKLHLAKLHSLKTGLMQDLLSGKVKVNMDNKTK